MAKVFKTRGAVAAKKRRAEKNVSVFERPDLEAAPAVEAGVPEKETPLARAERLFQEAYAAGHEAGMQAGLARFNELVGEAHRALESASQALREAEAAFLEGIEPQVVELAKMVASRILRREARTDPDLVRNTVRAALENLVERKHAIVRLNPRDIETLAERGVPVAEAFQSFEKIEIAADESVPHGGCTIETKIVDVDARLDTQLMRIFDALEG